MLSLMYIFSVVEPPKNKMRKIIFKWHCILPAEDKLKIVGKLIGRQKQVHEDDIYQCMLDLHDLNKKINEATFQCFTIIAKGLKNNQIQEKKEAISAAVIADDRIREGECEADRLPPRRGR